MKPDRVTQILAPNIQAAIDALMANLMSTVDHLRTIPNPVDLDAERLR